MSNITSGSPFRRIKAFTLIELLVVIAIILILISIALPNFLEAQLRAKVARVTADLRTITTALETYYIDWGTYPDDSEDEFDADDHGLAQLTTPLTYLTELPFDVFIGGGKAEDGHPVYFEMGSTGIDPWTLAYGFAVSNIVPGSNPPKTYKIDAYALYSHGPNQIDDFDGEGDFPFSDCTINCNPCDLGADGTNTVSYNPTNGTRSRGNIHMFGGEYRSGHWCLDGVVIRGRGAESRPTGR
ncbi:MAG: prepilin-type N-terminal cleavage/methylation domain-containing protein [Candidatus Omnitrophica bacterium]|nr:prepilin-type N-terminal cleavage/methylation domain-containing protein [Candidatus Omnitrophota bacterium]